MNQLIVNGSEYGAYEFDSVTSKLPVGVYTLLNTLEKGYFLKKVMDKFPLPTKIYNSKDGLINRWMKAWEKTEKNLGIVLMGEKGTGKTITAQQFCNNSNMPVIIISQPYSSEGFRQFLSNPIFKNSIVLIDEFEKLYKQQGEDNDVAPLLSLFDGMYDTKFIFMLTSNSLKLNEYLMNRPGRIKYKTEFDFLTPSDAAEIVQDKLINKEHEDSVYEMLNLYGSCTMDILTKVIDDMNTFDQDAVTCASYMNLEEATRDFDVYFKLDCNDKLYEIYPLYREKLKHEEYISRYLRFTADAYETLKLDLVAKYGDVISEKSIIAGLPSGLHVDDYVVKEDDAYVMTDRYFCRLENRNDHIDKYVSHDLRGTVIFKPQQHYKKEINSTFVF